MERHLGFWTLLISTFEPHLTLQPLWLRHVTHSCGIHPGCHSHHRDSHWHDIYIETPFLGEWDGDYGSQGESQINFESSCHGALQLGTKPCSEELQWTGHLGRIPWRYLERMSQYPNIDGDWDMSWYVNDVHDVNGSNVTTPGFFWMLKTSPVVLAKAFDAKIHGIYRSLTSAKAWHRLLSRRSSSGQPLEDYWRCVTWWRLILIWSIGISIAIGL